MSVKPFNTPIAMDSVHTAVDHQHSHATDDDSDPSVPRHAREQVPDTIHHNLLRARNDIKMVFTRVVSLFAATEATFWASGLVRSRLLGVPNN